MFMKPASENTSESEPAINQDPVMNNSDIGNFKVNKVQSENSIENRLAIHFGDGSVNFVSAMKGARIRTTAASNIEEKSRSQIISSDHEIDEERESLSEEQHSGTSPRKCSTKFQVLTPHDEDRTSIKEDILKLGSSISCAYIEDGNETEKRHLICLNDNDSISKPIKKNIGGFGSRMSMASTGSNGGSSGKAKEMSESPKIKLFAMKWVVISITLNVLSIVGITAMQSADGVHTDIGTLGKSVAMIAQIWMVHYYMIKNSIFVMNPPNWQWIPHSVHILGL
jgi:hypothetical protein